MSWQHHRSISRSSHKNNHPHRMKWLSNESAKNINFFQKTSCSHIFFNVSDDYLMLIKLFFLPFPPFFLPSLISFFFDYNVTECFLLLARAPSRTNFFSRFLFLISLSLTLTTLIFAFFLLFFYFFFLFFFFSRQFYF